MLPVSLAMILSAPCIGFTFISDDYNFLQRAVHFRLEQLIPDAQSAFYRPISREIYFGVLSRIAPSHPVVAHVGNALLLAVALALVAMLAGRLGGAKFGLLTGLFLAALGALPLLVGWVSCSQDLFAMIFVAAALLTAWNGRLWASACLIAAGILSKETAIFFFPGILFLALQGAEGPRGIRARLIPYGLIFILWAGIHPKIRSFVSHGLATGAGGYVGVDNPFMARNAVRMVGTFLNLPPTGIHTPWPHDLTGAFVVALFCLGVAVWAGRRWDGSSDGSWPGDGSTRTIVWTGVLAGLLPGVLTVISAKHWFPYYACMPAIGTSMLLALPLRRKRWFVGMAAVAVFLVLGIW